MPRNRFTIIDPDLGIEFSDALDVPEDTPEDVIEAMKQERFNNWKASAFNPPVINQSPPEDSVDEPQE
jgi:hypothetical protein